MKSKWKRPLAFLLSAAMLVSLSGTSVHATGGGNMVSGGLCEHHTEHTEDCGYAEEQPGTDCTHVCEVENGCVTDSLNCSHEHDENCYPKDEEPDAGLSEGEERKPSECKHEHDEKCYKTETNCIHEHDEDCGYSEGMPGAPCAFVCEECTAENEETDSDNQQEEECTCDPLCTEDAINGDCPVCGVEDVDFKDCKGAEEPDAPVCTCDTLCTEDATNSECPVCSAEDADLTDCKGIGEPDVPVCTCDTLCTEDSINTDCPVCSAEGADLTDCKGEQAENALVQTITAWEWIDEEKALVFDEESGRWVLALPGVNADNQADFDTVVSMLPQKISAAMEGTEEPEEITLSGWVCESYKQDEEGSWPISGTFLFTAALPDGYLLVEDAERPEIYVQISKITLYADGCNHESGEGSTIGTDGICTVCKHFGYCGADTDGDGTPEDTVTWEMVPNDNVYTLTITGTGAMTDWSRPLFQSKLSDYRSITACVVGSGVTTIGNLTFTNLENMSSIQIPDTVTSIGNSAFNGCKALKEIEIPDSVTQLGIECFGGCTSLTSVTIPDQITSIPQYCFCECSGLENITIPNTVTNIDGYAFNKCSSLTTIQIPDSVKRIGYGAFQMCTGLTELTIPSGVTEILNQLVAQCKFESFVIPNGVTSIGWAVFYQCSNLKSLVIPPSVTSINSSMIYEGVPADLKIYNLSSCTTDEITPKAAEYAIITVKDGKTEPQKVLPAAVAAGMEAYEGTVYDASYYYTDDGQGQWYVEKDGGYVPVTAEDDFEDSPTFYYAKKLTADSISITVSPEVQIYDGAEAEYEITVKDGETVLTKDTHYTCEITSTDGDGTSAGTNAGMVTITVTGVQSNGYIGTREVTFEIKQSGSEIPTGGVKTYKGTTETTTFTYGDTITVKVQAPRPTGVAAMRFAAPTANQMAVYKGDTQISEAADAVNGVYTMTIDTGEKGLSIGENTLTAKYVGNSNMAGTAMDFTVTVQPKPLTAAVDSAASKEYDGTSSFTNVVLTLDDVVSGDTVTATAAGNTADANVGTNKTFTATSVTLDGTHKDYYTLAPDKVSGSVAITPKTVSAPSITLNGDSFEYTGSAIEPGVTVKDGDTVIDPKEYDVSYSGNTNAGQATVTITDKTGGNYTLSTATKTFEITKPSLTTATVTLEIPEGGYTYDGQPHTPGITVVKNGVTVDPSEYDVTYSNSNGGTAGGNVNAGTVTVTVTAKADGNYSGSNSTATFEVSKRSVLAVVTAQDKTYDGTRNAEVTAEVTEGLVGTDSITITGLTGTFVDANAGTKKVVRVNSEGAVISGGDNYNVIIPGTTSANILKDMSATPPAAGEGYDINYLAETIYVERGYEVYTAETGGTQILSGWISDYLGKTLYVRKVEDNNHAASGWTAFTVAARPAAPQNLTKTDETLKGQENGELQGVTTSMEYSTNNGASWTGCSGTTVTGLAGGTTVQVREKATLTMFSGEIATLTIERGAGITVTFDQNGQEASGMPGEQTDFSYGDTLGKPKDPVANDVTLAFMGWYKDKSGTQEWNFATDKLTEQQVTLYAKWEEKQSVNITGVEAATDLIYSGQTQKGYTGTPTSDYKGEYEVTYSADPILAGKYTVTFKVPDTDPVYRGSLTLNFTIGKKPLIIKADDKAMVVNTELPPFTYQAIGLVGKDAFAEPDFHTTANIGIIGDYEITISGGTLTNENSYTVTYKNGTLTVTNKKVPNVTLKANPTSISGGGNVTLTVDGVPAGGTVTMTCSDESITVEENGTGWTAKLPNKTAEYTFTAAYSGDAEHEGVTAACTVKVTYRASGDSSSDSSGGNPSGGGSSSGVTAGSSSNNTGNTVTAPSAAPDSPTVSQTAPAKPDGNGNVSIPDNAVDNAILTAKQEAARNGKARNGIAVAVPVETTKDQQTLNVTLKMETLDTLVADGVKQFTITTEDMISVSLNGQALKALDSQTAGDIILEVKRKAVSAQNLSKEAATAIGRRPVYDISLWYVKGGNKTGITSINGNTVSVSIPYTPAKNENTGSLYAVYVTEDGKVEWLTRSSYNSERKTVIFEAGYFGIYGVGFKASGQTFTDITDHWAKEDIEFAASRGLLERTGKGLFGPDTGVTRGMFVTALGTLAEIDPSQYQEVQFSDVAEGAYYAPYINWAAEEGIISGTSVIANTASPDLIINREQMAVIMENYTGKLGYTLPRTRNAVTFADDAQISSWAKAPVTAMQQAGILPGKDGNRFDPAGTVTRAEAAAVLRRFVEISIDPQTANGWSQNDSGTWHYFYDDGTMAVNTIIDGFIVDRDGVRK